MILNLRGGGGAGKTTVFKGLIDTYLVEPLWAPNFRTKNVKKPVAWRLAGELFVLGRYQTGGDGIRFEPLMDMIRAFAPRGHVMFENVLVSGNVSSWLPFRREIGGKWIWATLDTPQALCVERIYGRNGNKPIKEDVHAAHDRRVRKKVQELVDLGENSVWVDHTRSLEHVVELLKSGGWSP